MSSQQASLHSSFIESAYYNFNPQKVEDIPWRGVHYRSLRNAWECAKQKSEAAKISLAAMDPYRALDYGNAMKPEDYRDDWAEIIEDTLLGLLSVKFGGDVRSRDYECLLRNGLVLARTGDAKIFYENHIHDNDFGNCVCDKCQPTRGLNLLGNGMEQVRKSLIELWDGDPSDDDCMVCWIAEGRRVACVGRIMYWTAQGLLKQDPYCAMHAEQVKWEAEANGDGKFWKVQSIEGLGNHATNTPYTTQWYYGSNWTTTPAKNKWTSLIWDCTTGEMNNYEVVANG